MRARGSLPRESLYFIQVIFVILRPQGVITFPHQGEGSKLSWQLFILHAVITIIITYYCMGRLIG